MTDDIARGDGTRKDLGGIAVAIQGVGFGVPEDVSGALRRLPPNLGSPAVVGGVRRT